MSSITFSQLPNQANITAATIIPTVSANTNFTVTAAALQNYINGGNGNITSGNISVTGNITANNFIGNGSYLSNITGANITGTISVTGNITANNFIGNSVAASNITGTYLTVSSGNLANLVVTGTTVLNPYVETTSAIGNVSTSFTPTMSNGPVQTLTLTGNIILNTPSGMSTGQSITLIITQPSSGNAFMTANTAYKFAYSSNVLSTTGNAIDMMGIFYSGTNYLVNLAKGYR